MIKIIIINTSQFDLDLSDHVKKLREKLDWSQNRLCLEIGVGKSFVSNVETRTQPQKYSTRHIALLAKAFGYKNISDLMKFPTPKNDKIKITVEQLRDDKTEKVISSKVLGMEVVIEPKKEVDK